MSDDLRVKLGPVKHAIVRECWITILHDASLNTDLVIGAGTKEACIRAFKRISSSERCNEDLVYHVTLIGTREGSEPTAPLFQPSMICTCVIGVSRPTDYCRLHGGRLCA
jgi:hypothetical protein